MPITHAKVLTQADEADETKVRPSDWNGEHVVELTASDVGATDASLFRKYVASVAFGSSWLDTSTGGVVRAGDQFELSNNTVEITISRGAVLFTPPATNAERHFIFLPTSTDITAQFAAPDPTDDRIDLVVMQVIDVDTGSAEIQVVTGTPGEPAPSVPDNAFKLWEQTVPANEPELTNWPEPEDVRNFVNTGFDGGTISRDTIFLVAPLLAGGARIEPLSEDEFEISELGVFSFNQTRIVLQAAAASNGDDDYVRFFETGGLTRADRPTIDPTAIADPNLQAVVVALIALGLVIEG